MAKIIAVCGKICSGKTYYSNNLKVKEKAVILSCDEITACLFNNALVEKHDEITAKIQEYLKKKSVELVNAGCNVILDWGFWSAESRKDLSEYYHSKNIPCEWHYIYVDDNIWHKNIEERNHRILSGKGGSDYYLDEGLMGKLLSKWEPPSKDEIDVWYTLERE